MKEKQNIIIPESMPDLIVIVGPCRVGTTALANVFAKAGVTSYMQPIKSARRAEADGEQVAPWIIQSEKIALDKETVGAETPAEFFDPVEILLDLNYPKEKIKLIPIVRDPRKTLASWREMWSDVDLKKFVESFQLTQKIKDSAEKKGIQVFPYVHEIIRDQSSEIVIKKIFNKLNINEIFEEDLINWQRGAKFGEGNSNESKVKFFDVPPERFVKEVKNWGSYNFREEPELKLSGDDANFISNNKELIDIYENFRKGCEQSLDLQIKPYSFFDY